MSPLSDIQGPPLAGEGWPGLLTMGGFLSELAQRFGSRQALCWRDEAGDAHSWTYAQLLQESESVARSLLALGVGKETRVGLLVSNRPEWLFSMFGASMVGAVLVAMNTFSTRQELEYQLRLADVEFLILENFVASHDFLDDVTALCPTLATQGFGELLSEQLPYLRRVVCLGDARENTGVWAWQKFLAAGERIDPALVAATLASSSPVDRGYIFFSSGTTAQPKAIQQTQRAATLQCWRLGNFFRLDSTVRTWSANGFFWSGNFAMALGNTLSVGGCLVLQRYFDPDVSLRLLQQERVSHALAWPHQEARLRECPGWNSADLSALRYVDANSVLASHPRVRSEWYQPQGYGMTETFTFVTGRFASDVEGSGHGEVLPGNTVRIVDPLSGETLPMGETGEIITKGPTLTIGYLKIPPEDTFDREGFIHTGDEGYFDSDGRLIWKGRLSEIIKTGGANVSPAEIDATLTLHEAVQSAYTVGIPHETLGEMVVSCVVLREGQQLSEPALREFARESLASYKVPRRILFYIEDDLPLTGSNKVRRKQLAIDVAARLSGE